VPPLAILCDAQMALEHGRGGWCTSMLRGVLVAAATLGCGARTRGLAADDGGDAGADPSLASAWQSGTRLRARVRDGGGGALMLVAWSDTKLGIDCGFVRLPGGSYRCLPLLLNGGRPVDSLCPADLPPGDLSAYVSARETVDLSTRPLSARVVVADDGTRENVGLYDTTHMTPCVPLASLVAGAASMVCVPADAAIANPPPFGCLVQDTTCAPCPAVGFALTSEGTAPQGSELACGAIYQLYTFGVASPGTTGCLGAPTCSTSFVADSTFATPTVERTGTGRLHVDLFTDSAGRAVSGAEVHSRTLLRDIVGFAAPDRTFFDEAVSAPCLPRPDSPSGDRCLPLPSAGDPGFTSTCHLRRYADAGCTQPVYVTGGCPLPPSCDGKGWFTAPDAAYSLGDTLSVEKVYAASVAGCAEDTAFDPVHLVEVVRALGPRMPYDSFAPITDRVE